MCRRYFRRPYGRHRPACEGACLVAHTGWENLTPVSLFMIIVPLVCWYYFLWEDTRDLESPAVLVIAGILSFVCLLLLFVTMLTEPGILQTITYEEYSEEDPEIPVRIVSHVLLDGREYELKHFRAKFSRFTANCIENFDHYCPWVGNAIGKRNYRYFIFFMISCLVLAMLITGSCIALLFLKSDRDHTSILNTVEHTISATLLAVYGFCMSVSLLGLCGFHLRAIATNRTTNEILKGTYSTRNINPNDQGCYKNFCTFLCSPVPPSKVSVFYDLESSLLDEGEEALSLTRDGIATGGRSGDDVQEQDI